jgi:nucleoside phosphorylase
MKKLIVCATKEEARLIFAEHNFVESKEIKNLFESDRTDFLICGIGAPYTIFNLTQLLNKRQYKLVVNVGIAGAFNRNIKIGDVVAIEQDIFADMAWILLDSAKLSEGLEPKDKSAFANRVSKIATQAL